MLLQNPQNVTVTNVNLVKIQLTGGKFSKILSLRSNVHKCRISILADEKKQKKERRGCINKHGNCKARFPRQTFEKTEVDPKTGALNIKKGKRWINTLTPIVTWWSGPLLRMACTSPIFL